MNLLDYALIFLLVVFFLRGLWIGAARQMASIIGLLLGFWLAFHYYGFFAHRLVKRVPHWPYPEAAVFVAIFLFIWLFFAFAGIFLSRFFRKTPLVWADRFLGGSIGLVKTIVAAAILIFALTVFLPPGSRFLRNSKLAPYVQIGAKVLIKATPNKVKKVFEEKRKDLLNYWYHQENKEKPTKPLKQARIQRSDI